MASRDQLGELANVAQLTGIDAVRLIGMIVQAASTARVHKRNCRQFAQHLRLIGNLLEQLKISELKRYPETREPLEQLEDALRRSFVLVNSCQDKSYLYLLAMGWNIVYQFRKAQNEIDRYLRLVPLITLVDNARVRERLEYIEMDQCEYTFDEEDKKVQDALLNPDEFSHQTAVLTKVLSCSYPNVPLDEALKKEKEKLQMELQRSQSNMDVSQCEVIQHLLGVTDIVANTLPEKGNAKKVDSNNDEKCSDHEEYTTKQANTYVASSRSSTGKDAATITVGIPENGFTLKELAAATNNFSPVNQIGIGSNIYRGELSDGTTVAVKLFNSNTGFAPELDACSRVQHKNIAELIGCCTSTKPTKKFLVYEFVPNRSLHHHLNENNETVLDWSARFKIALGCAKALAYLHQDCNPKIIHCNVKPSNILLDNAFEPKLTNFSVAKILGSETSLETANHVGSLGYIDPEYAVTGQVSEKSDIFSFGVLVLELITGKKPIIRNEIFESLVAWATPLLEQALKKNMYGALVDPRLSYQYNPYEMMRMVACAAAAVRPTGKSRPLMSQIVGVLDGVLPLEVLITRSSKKE